MNCYLDQQQLFLGISIYNKVSTEESSRMVIIDFFSLSYPEGWIIQFLCIVIPMKMGGGYPIFSYGEKYDVVQGVLSFYG